MVLSQVGARILGTAFHEQASRRQVSLLVAGLRASFLVHGLAGFSRPI